MELCFKKTILTAETRGVYHGERPESTNVPLYQINWRLEKSKKTVL